MKAAVRESVDREDVAIVLTEPCLERLQDGRLGEFARRLVAQAQADGERAVGADPLLHRQGVPRQSSEGLGPGLAPVDVGTVGEMQPVR